MALYLDTEFNGFKGNLISLGIYNTNGEHWYNELDYKLINKPIILWVIQNVIPKLEGTPIDFIKFQMQLCEYLNKHENEIIYADWAEDFQHLLDHIYANYGIKYLKKLKLELITTEDKFISKIPHHALYDAEVLYKNHTMVK